MVVVLPASFRLENQFFIVSSLAICIPFILGDVVVLIFCSVWYTRPIPAIGYWVFATDTIFILLQLLWLIIIGFTLHINLEHQENEVQAHELTTSVVNDITTVHYAMP